MVGIITKEKVETEVLEFISNTEMFLVDITLSASNNLQIFIDSPIGVTIEQCVQLSRHIESKFDREEEDYELTVASAGISEPFKVYKQYLKNVGRTVTVTTSESKSFTGILAQVNEQEIQLQYQELVKQGPKGKKKKVDCEISIPFSNIKKTLLVISLK